MWIYWNIFFKIQSWFTNCYFGAYAWVFSLFWRLPEFGILILIAWDGTCLEIAEAYNELWTWMGSLFADPFWTPMFFSPYFYEPLIL